MEKTGQHTAVFTGIVLGLVLLFLADLCLGPVRIPLRDVWQTLTGSHASKPSWDYIILQYRLPKALTAVLAGMGLSISGLLMQTLFRNPLAGPFVLGLSSGSSLGVALLVLGSGILPAVVAVWATSAYAIVLASCAGSLLVLLAVLVVARRLRDTAAMLVVGLMFGSFTSAFVGVLTYFSTAEQLQKFTFWSLGNLGNLSWEAIAILAVCILIGLALALRSVKPLDALLLGENYARSLGIDYKKSRLLIILATSLLAGSVTAFAGPIAFIGLAVPHMAKLLLRTGNHFLLYLATLALGAGIMLLCDLCAQWPGSNLTLPINAITSIIGAPVVIWLLVRKQKISG